jgi:hypothetical protein
MGYVRAVLPAVPLAAQAEALGCFTMAHPLIAASAHLPIAEGTVRPMLTALTEARVAANTSAVTTPSTPS